ncbi:uncharacterized protein FA14DRAFT_162662 [Meira miltonrushii]|uniref:Amino acid transporter transmembrane domain-containing protein n=1 Tax=Meira miltonrushii TaxID=1280837 RepID=A0A316V2J1_9BASI|nr:uncharacterized protein FA14DRAFT_162662 [Meira miltonrushii]PWN31766.1 hypothetical protein FA14DRAFT_162662 [Meira miltonrushii]
MSAPPPHSASMADADGALRRSTVEPQDTQLLAQRSPPGSVRSQILLQRTVLHIDDDEGDEEGSTTVRGLNNGTTTDVQMIDGRDGNEDDDDDDYDDEEPLTTINVGHTAWDESDDEEDQQTARRTGRNSNGRPRLPRLRSNADDRSYLNSLRPTSSILRSWLVKITKSPSAQASLSAPHVTANLFSASLNPAVLLSMPAFFDRTGITLGIVGLVVVAALAGAGGGLWVVLGRYVGGANIEAITAASFGRNTRWKGNIGRAISGLLLACYATGTAVVAYFALADLLLQVLFHYSPRGIPLHNRLFVTIVIGGLITTPLVIYPLAKRNLIRLSTTLAVLFYPCILAILLAYVYQQPPTSEPHFPIKSPEMNPLHSPSVWAPFSLLPLLSLSASPLQIIAHNRSLRRTGMSGSNVKAFLGAQAAQTVAAIALAIGFGIGVGTQGMGKRLGVEVHPNLFTTLPLTDNLNLARILFMAILISHLALCLVTVRSAWSRLLFLFNLNPFRTSKRPGDQDTDENDADRTISASTSSGLGTVGTTPNASQRRKKSLLGKKWTKPAKDALAGVLLWAMTAVTAYWSGVGGIHLRKGQKNDPDDAAVQANFTRAQEVLGLMGAGVGFVLPAFVWIILFHIRQPRAILPPFAADMARQASAWFLGPQSVLAVNKWRRGSRAPQNGSLDSAERQPLLDDQDGDDADEGPSPSAFRHSLAQASEHDEIPSSRNEEDMNGRANGRRNGNTSIHHSTQETDEATRILLARKERELQRRTRGRRIYQDIIVLAGILPLGVSLIVLGALDLRHGGW